MHLLIAPDDFTNKNPGWINLKWTWPDDGKLIGAPILLFRQISPNPAFSDSFDAVDYAFNEGGVEDVDVSMVALYNAGKQASLDIGEYAPTGVYCTETQFNENKCGIDNPSGGSIGGCSN